MTPDEIAAFNARCFPAGLASKEARVAEVQRALRFTRSLDMVAMSLLSDVQELIERGRADDARRRINFVKWMLSERADLAALEG